MRLWIGHGLAAAVVLAGVLVQLIRPLAPDLGPLPEAAVWFDGAYLEQVRAYRDPLYAAGLAAFGLRVAIPLLVAFTAAGQRMTNRIVERVGVHRPARAAAAVVATVVVGTDVALSPLSFWAGYVHEGTHGFRTHGFGGWLTDWFAFRAPAWLVVVAVAAAGYWLVRRLPRAWPPVAGLGGAALVALAVFATPAVFEPLLYRTEPLPEGPVRAEVERVVERSGEDIERIVVADASRRTTKSNAYISGLATSRQVVLYDNLVLGTEPAEIGVVLAHELGHQQHADLTRGTLGGAAGVVVLVYGLAAFVRRRSRAQRQDGPGDPRAAAIVVVLVVLAYAVSVPVQNAASRRAEAAADLAALRITEAPATYVRVKDELARANLSDPAPPRWTQHLWGTHPPSVARLEMGQRWADGAIE